MIYYVGGNVEISPDVAIASGVILEAASGSRLVIEPGVCIGTGVVIQAHGGTLTLAAGVNLGKEVLLVGSGIVGPRGCIGAESTLINPQIEADAVVPARSLLGAPLSPSVPQETSASAPASRNGAKPSPTGAPSEPEATAGEAPEAAQAGSDQTDTNGSLAAASTVYGRDQVMQLVKTLFPHRDLLNTHGDSS